MELAPKTDLLICARALPDILESTVKSLLVHRNHALTMEHALKMDLLTSVPVLQATLVSIVR